MYCWPDSTKVSYRINKTGDVVEFTERKDCQQMWEANNKLTLILVG